MPPAQNPFTGFSPEDQLDIQDQLTKLYTSGQLNPAQKQGAGFALQHLAAAKGIAAPSVPDLAGPPTNNYQAVPGSDSDQAKQTRLGQMVPEAAVPALQAVKKYAIDPFDAAAKFGSDTAKDVVNNAAVNYDAVRHMDGMPLSPFAQFLPNGPSDAERLARQEQEHPIALGVARGIADVAGSTVTDPRNWPFFASGSARPILQKVISGGFGAQMAHGSLESAKDLYTNWDVLTPAQRSEQAATAGISGLMAAGAAGHALSDASVTPSESPKSVTINKSPEASVVPPDAYAKVSFASSPVVPADLAPQRLASDLARPTTPLQPEIAQEMTSLTPTENTAPLPLAPTGIIGEPTAKPRTPGEPLQQGFDFKPAEDLGNAAREATLQAQGPLPRGERRAQPRSPEEQLTQTLFGQARQELGDDASSDQVMARVDELKGKPSVLGPTVPQPELPMAPPEAKADPLAGMLKPDIDASAPKLSLAPPNADMRTAGSNYDLDLKAQAMAKAERDAGNLPEGTSYVQRAQQLKDQLVKRYDATLAPPKPVETINAPKPAGPTALARPIETTPVDTDSARISRNLTEVDRLLQGDPAVKRMREIRQQIIPEATELKRHIKGLQIRLNKVRQNADMVHEVEPLEAQVRELRARGKQLVQVYRETNARLGDQPSKRYTDVNYDPSTNDRLTPEAKAKAADTIRTKIDAAHNQIRQELSFQTDPARRKQLEAWLQRPVIEVNGKGTRAGVTTHLGPEGRDIRIPTPEITLKTARAVREMLGDGRKTTSLFDLVPKEDQDRVRDLGNKNSDNYDREQYRQEVQTAARNHVEGIRENLRQQLKAAQARESAGITPSTETRNLIRDLKTGKTTIAKMADKDIDKVLAQPGVIAQELGPSTRLLKKGANGEGTVLGTRDLPAKFTARLEQEKANRAKPVIEGNADTGKPSVPASPRPSAEAGFATPGLLFDVRKLPGELWRRFVSDPLLRKLGQGAKYQEIHALSPTLADLFYQRDNGPAAYRDEAAQNVKNILGGASHAKERLAALWADAESRANLEKNHPEEYSQAKNDPEVQGIVSRYQQYAHALTEERATAGFATLPEDYLRRVYEQHMQQPGGQSFEKAVSLQDLPNKSRQATAEYHYQNGVHEFGPTYGTKYIAQKLTVLDRAIVGRMAHEGTLVPKAGNLPSEIQFSGKTYYSPDQAKLVDSKDVYGVYDPLKTTKFKVGDDAILAPKNITDVANATDRGGSYKPGVIKQTFQKGVIGLGFGIPHAFANVPRRIMNSFEGGMANPRAWNASFKVLFGKELRDRAQLGTDDPTLSALMRRGAARFDTENTDIGSKWVGLRIGHDLIYKPGSLGGIGGVDVRARMEYADRLITHNPNMSWYDVAQKVENQFGKYTKENWTKTQQGMAHVVAFPGWIYSSIRAGLEHPLRATVPAAVTIYAINQALYKKGMNRLEDKDDISRIHVGDHSFSPTVFSEPFAKAVAGPVLGAAQSLIRGGSNREISDQFATNIPKSIGKTLYAILPYYAAPLELAFNRQFAGTEKEVFRPGAFDRKGKTGLSEGTEAILQHLGTRVIPQLGRLAPEGSTGEQGLDIPSFLSSQVGLPAFKQDAEARLLKNVAETGQASHLKDDYVAQRPTELGQLLNNEPGLALDDQFHAQFELLQKAVKDHDNAIVAFPENKKALEASKAVVLAAADEVNDAYQRVRQEQLDAKTDKPIDKLKSIVLPNH